MKRIRPEIIIVAIVGLSTIAGVVSFIAAEILDIARLKTLGIILISIGVGSAFLPLLCLCCVIFYEKILKKKARS